MFTSIGDGTGSGTRPGTSGSVKKHSLGNYKVIFVYKYVYDSNSFIIDLNLGQFQGSISNNTTTVSEAIVSATIQRELGNDNSLLRIMNEDKFRKINGKINDYLNYYY